MPESHWKINAISPAQAVGPYQFIAKIALAYGLKIDGIVDERRDPLRSGEACLNLLNDLYKKTKKWSLSLSGYNGGFLWDYLRKTKEEEKEATYEEFVGFMEDKINNTRDQIKNSQHVYHRFGKKDSLKKHCRKCRKEPRRIKF